LLDDGQTHKSRSCFFFFLKGEEDGRSLLISVTAGAAAALSRNRQKMRQVQYSPFSSYK
jgi:hypothetical protein